VRLPQSFLSAKSRAVPLFDILPPTMHPTLLPSERKTYYISPAQSPQKMNASPKKQKKKDEKKNRTSGKSWQSSKNRKKENCISPKQRNLRRTFEILLNSNKISSCVAGERGRERKVQRPISKWQLSRGSTESAERGKNIGAYQRAKKKNKKSEVECRSKSDT